MKDKTQMIYLLLYRRVSESVRCVSLGEGQAIQGRFEEPFSCIVTINPPLPNLHCIAFIVHLSSCKCLGFRGNVHMKVTLKGGAMATSLGIPALEEILFPPE